MVQANPQFAKLSIPYIFPIIEEKLSQLRAKHPSQNILNMGIGDIALPLAKTVAKALQEAVEEMTHTDTLKGYGPAEGYYFLRESIIRNSYAPLSRTPDEIFISDGINTDITNIVEIFSKQATVALPTPSYPAYLASSLLAGKHPHLTYLPCMDSTGHIPIPPSHAVDLVYLCSPHNPTGEAMSRERLQAFVDYAHKHQALLLFDGAYEAFITSPTIPRSIYEIPGAEEVAIEFRSFSKSAGFTGLRCSYLVIPHQVQVRLGRKSVSLQGLWKKRQNIKYNGVAYPIQKAAAAALEGKGKEETKAQVQSYLSQAQAIRKALQAQGHTCCGGIHSPYIWWKTPSGLSSWEFFTLLLEKHQLLTIPGVGFGKEGEGYVRLSAFCQEDKTKQLLSCIPHIQV